MPTHKGKRAGRREGEQKGERREEEKRGERRREDCSLLGIITNIAIVRMSQREERGKKENEVLLTNLPVIKEGRGRRVPVGIPSCLLPLPNP